MKNYSFSDKVILRTPLQKVETDISWEKIQDAFKHKLYREALFVASPNLYELYKTYEEQPETLKQEEIDGLVISLYKYYSRFSNRCTPFGLYAYVSVIGLARQNDIQIQQQSIRKITKFDTFFLAKMLAFIEKQLVLRKALTYYPNSALYSISNKYRYVEFYYKEETRLHKLSGVAKNQYLETIVELARTGASFDTLLASLTAKGIEQEQGQSFLHTLIDNQFIVSELGITITGDDYLGKLITVFKEPRFQFFEAQEILSLLLDLSNRLNLLEKREASVDSYLSLFEYVNQHFAKVPIKKLVQVDGYRDQSASKLSYSFLKQIRTAIQVINKLSPQPPQTNIDRFAKRFSDRYEEQEIPLVQALDPDIGINYAKQLGAKTPLIEGLALQGSKKNMPVEWDKKRSVILQKLLTAYRLGESEIVLQDEDFNLFPEDEDAYFDTFSIFFSAFREQDLDKLHIKTIWGPTAASLIGRFGNLDERVAELGAEINQKEEEIYAGKIVAEVIHLPQARVGNVLHRKVQRSYEIPYLGTSSLPLEQQIPVSDLMVSVKYGKVRLRSAFLNKEVVPRLSNAHNYGADALPIYHFLCDLALQDSRPLSLSWGFLQYEYPYTPRVSYKNIVLSRASWLLTPQETKELFKNKHNTVFLADFLKLRKIPQVVALCKGDNEVVINFDNELSRKVFFSMIKRKGFVDLKEFFFQEPSITGSYANEFVLSATKNMEKEANSEVDIPVGDYQNKETKTTYSIGDEWLYYKFYCGDKIAETVLSKGLLPLVQDMEEKQLVDKFFFIRYNDENGFHIRLRLKLKDKQYFTDCINTIKYHVAPLESEGIVWKTQVDTYTRETERYGYHSIDATESLFHYDSKATLQFTDLISGEEGERIRWLFSLLSMDRLLTDFDCTLSQKVAITRMLKSGFGKEFNRKGLLNKQINELYNTHEEVIATFLDKSVTHPLYYPLWDLLEERSAANHKSIAHLIQLDKDKKLPTPLLVGAVPSYLHMICNRIFLSRHRVQEMVVYDFLYKHYSKLLHLQKVTSSETANNK